LDNQIHVYGAQDRFKVNRKKHFSGHLVAGYACKPGFSPDGKFLSSGDSNGNVWVWDWKTCKVLKKFKAHTKVVVNTEWHPHETSKMATCSWDGVRFYCTQLESLKTHSLSLWFLVHSLLGLGCA
jgi:pre-mRNA-processing factor 17